MNTMMSRKSRTKTVDAVRDLKYTRTDHTSNSCTRSTISSTPASSILVGGWKSGTMTDEPGVLTYD